MDMKPDAPTHEMVTFLAEAVWVISPTRSDVSALVLVLARGGQGGVNHLHEAVRSKRCSQSNACQYCGLVVRIAAIIGTRTGPITDIGVVHEFGRAHGLTLYDARAIDANRGEYSIRVVDALDLDLSFSGHPRRASMWTSTPPGEWAIEQSEGIVWIEHGYGETPSPTWVGVRAEDLAEAIRAR